MLIYDFGTNGFFSGFSSLNYSIKSIGQSDFLGKSSFDTLGTLGLFSSFLGVVCFSMV